MLLHLVDLEAPFEASPGRDYDAVELVRFALTNDDVGDYWSSLGSGWLEQGVPAASLLSELRAFETDRQRPQPDRHRARRIRKVEAD
jgi:hypothetical protein